MRWGHDIWDIVCVQLVDDRINVWLNNVNILFCDFGILYSKTIVGTKYIENIRCGIVYVSPQGSKYATEDPYLELQEEIFRYCMDAKNIILFGYCRCKNVPDYIKFDEFISEIRDMLKLYDESNKLYDYFQRFQIHLGRKSVDESINDYGYSLLEL